MLEFVIPCLLGLESLVGDEIRKLGLSDVRVENGRVLCRGEARDIARLNINLRCGARVILVLHKFRATDFETLFQGTRAVRWEDWIPREGEFPVVGYSINSTLHSVPACQSIVKKAVVDRLSAAYGIARLPENYRRLIRMRFFDEYSYEEIAVKLSLPLGTVKTQIHRARERMCRLIVENDNR